MKPFMGRLGLSATPDVEDGSFSFLLAGEDGGEDAEDARARAFETMGVAAAAATTTVDSDPAGDPGVAVLNSKRRNLKRRSLS